ncbi:MAG: type II toxin-antitoxin system RelE/ParE family toxin [Salinibacter sp.]
MYEVFLEGRAERDLKRLPNDIFQRVLPQIQSLAEEPRPPGCRKVQGTDNTWRVRVGDYRVIYEVRDDANEVLVMRVRHRREAYR